MSATIPQSDHTRILVLTVSPAGDAWYTKHPEIKTRKGDYDRTPRPSATDPVLVRVDGDLVVVYADDDRVPEGEVVQVADGVTAQRARALPVLQPGDAWLRAPDGGQVRPGICPFPVEQRWTLGPDPEVKEAKRATADGRALLDLWTAKHSRAKPGPETTRKVAVLAYQLGQAVGNGDLPIVLADAALDELFPPDVQLDPEDQHGLSSPLRKWPGTQEQLQAIVRDGARHPAPMAKMDGVKLDRPKRWRLGDDRELGQDLAVKLGGDAADHRRDEGKPLTAVYDRGAVHKVDARGVWRPMPDHELQKLAARYSGTYVATPTEKNPEACVPVKLSQGRIEAIARVAKMYLTVPGHFDAAPAGIACQGANGPVFLPVGAPSTGPVSEGVAALFGETPPGKVGEAVPLGPEHRVRASQVLPIIYDPEAKCPKFADFLDSIFDGLDDDERLGRITCILQFVGAALLGVGPRYGKALVLTGAGANGKSTLLDVISRLFPAEARVAVPMQSFGEDYKRSLFADAKINLCNELPVRDVISSEAVKDIITGEEVTARLPYRAPFQFKSRATHMFAANRLPPTSDLSRGFFRRFVIVDFPNSFEGREVIGLADQLVKELPGILNLAIRAAASLTEQGRYTIPESSRKAEAEWRQHSDSVSMWLHEATEAMGWTTSSAAHTAYKIWCERALLKPVSTKEFAVRLQGAKVKDKNSSGVRHWGLTPKRDDSHLTVDPAVAEVC